MELTAAALLVRRYLSATVITVLLLSGALAYGITQYQELSRQKDQLASDRKVFNDEKTAFEKYRADTAIAFNTQKLELDKRELQLQLTESENREQVTSLEKKVAEYDQAAGKMREVQIAISRAQVEKEAEEKLQKLMGEFSATGVDLSDEPACANAETKRRYSTAKAKYSEAYAFAEAHGLLLRYRYFFEANTHGMHFNTDCAQ